MVPRPGVIETRLCPPELRTSNVDRFHLLEPVAADQRPRLVALRAPAGYGKSTLAVQLVRSWGVPTAWYELDQEDDDVLTFVTHLVASIERLLPVTLDTGEVFFEPERYASNPNLLVSHFVNAFTRVDPPGFAIVIENCHLIRNPVIHFLIRELVAHAQPLVSFVMTSRRQLPVSVSRYQASSEAVVFGVDELRFSDAEVFALLSQTAGDYDPGCVSAVCRESDGWPALVRLMLAEADAESGWSRGFSRAVADYLQSEVIACYPEPVLRFLKATSILDFLTPELCDAYLEIDNSTEILETLSEDQLVVCTQSDLGPAFQYLRPLRKYMQSVLGADRRTYLMRAGECELLMGRVHSAIEHLLLAGAAEHAAQAIKGAGDELVRSGRYDMLRRWIDSLPSCVVRNDPWLSMWRGLAKITQGMLDSAQVYLENSLDRFRRRGNRSGMAEAELALSWIGLSRGQYESSRTLIEKAMPAIAQHKADLMPELIAHKALLLAVCGRMGEATGSASEALRLAQLSGDENVLSRVAARLSCVHYMRGDYSSVLQLRRIALPHESDLIPASQSHDAAFSGLEVFALALRDAGELEDAIDHARRSLDFKDSHGFTGYLPLAYYQLGIICADQGAYERAEECLCAAMEITESMGGQMFAAACCLSGLARIKCLQGRLVEAQTLADQGLDAARSLRESPFAQAVCEITALVPHMLVGDLDTVHGMALSVDSLASKIGARYIEALSQGLLASMHCSLGDHSAMLEHASRCLQLAARGRYVQDFVTFYRIYAPVLRAGLELGVETGFVQEVLTRVGRPALDLLEEMSSHRDLSVRQRALIPLTQIERAEGDLEDQLQRTLAKGHLVSPLSYAETAATLWQPDSRILAVNEDYVRIEIQCLGPFRTSAGGKEISPQDWRTTKARDLLAYLVHRRGPVQSDVILEDLWPGSESEQNRAVLHTNLYYLRKALQTITDRREIIVFGGGHYRLAEGCYTTDVDRFEALLAAAITRDGGTIASPELMEKAIALYKGDYLEGMDYSWVAAEQRRLRRVCLEARERLAWHYIREHECSKALAHALVLAEACPLSEDAHALVMTVYARLGDFASVKEQFALMSQVFDEELGSPPSPEIKRLYYSLCTGKR